MNATAAAATSSHSAPSPTSNVSKLEPKKVSGAEALTGVAVTKDLGQSLKVQKGPERKRETSKAELADRDKIMDGVAEKGEKATDKTKAFVGKSQALVRLQFQFKQESAADKRAECKEQALAKGVLALEDLEIAIKALKGSEKDIYSRLTSTFDYDTAKVRKLLKERKIPATQLKFDFAQERKALDTLHDVCEANGARRVEDPKLVKKSAAA